MVRRRAVAVNIVSVALPVWNHCAKEGTETRVVPPSLPPSLPTYLPGTCRCTGGSPLHAQH
jgi:hypothetical protein